MVKRDSWILALAIFVALMVVMSQLVQPVVPTGAWGLSFQQAGQPPTGPAAVQQQIGRAHV